jgi:diguanylate cyclase (GGDEF)-like protein
MVRVHGITPRIVAALALGFLIPLTAGLVYILNAERSQMEHSLQNFHEHTLHALAISTRDALYAFSPSEALNAGKMVINDQRILKIVVYSDIFQMPLVNLVKEQSGDGHDPHTLRRDIFFEGDYLGFVEVTVDRSYIKPLLAREQRQMILLFAGILLGGLALVLPLIYFRILRPIRRLTNQAERLRAGKLGQSLHWEGKDELSRLGQTLEAMRQSLNNSLIRTQELAVTDDLTGIPNRRAFMNDINRLLDHSRRYGSSLSIAFCDLDHFKTINDTYGHSVGDDVLCEFTRMVKERIRATDLLARIGGEEFALCMPETSLENATIVIEKIQRFFAGYTYAYGGTVTASFGVTEYTPGMTLESLISEADTALYTAKNSGRNQVVQYTPSLSGVDVPDKGDR